MSATGMMMGFAGLSAVSSGISGYAQYKAGTAEKAAYQYNADVVLEQTRQKEAATQAKYQALMGRQRALYAKAGVDITSGSPLLIALDTAMQAEEETGSIRQAGEEQAQLLRYYGKMAAWSGKVGGVTTFLSGLGGAGLGTAMAMRGYPYTAPTTAPAVAG